MQSGMQNTIIDSLLCSQMLSLELAQGGTLKHSGDTILQQPGLTTDLKDC